MPEIDNRYHKAEPMAHLLADRCKADPGFRATITEDPTDDFWLVVAVDAGVSQGRWDYVPSVETAAFALFLCDEKIKNAADPFAGVN